MYACYIYKDGSQGDAIWVNPEELAVSTSPAELKNLLRTKAETEYPEKKKLIQDRDLKLLIPVFTEGPVLEEKSIEEFWDAYSTYFPEWIRIGEQIKERLKQYDGKKTYWEIDPNEFVVGEESMDQHYYYDFRVSLLSGNCFPTKEAAEEFMESLTDAFKDIHESAGTTNTDVAANWMLSGSEAIHYWNWSYYGALIAPVWPSLYICPMNISRWRKEGEAESEDVQSMRKIWNVFETLETAKAANIVLQERFRNNGFHFPGIMEYQEYSAED